MESLNLQKLIRLGGMIVVAIIVVALVWPFYSVPTGSRGVVTRFGAIVGIEGEGLTILPPWEKLSIFSIRAETANVQSAEGATSDTQPVTTSLTVRYAIQPDKVSEVFEQYSHDGDLSSYVDTATHEIFKSVTARYDAPDLISQRPKVSADIYDALTAKLAKYGARVINIDMTGFSFSPTYMAAINDKVTQEQLRLAAENKLKTVEAEQKQKVAVAEAEANAVRATADGDAYARITNATAEAKAIQVQSQAPAQSAQILELRRIQVEQTKAEKWDGKLPEAVYAGAPIPFLNVGSK
ncbi:MAG TPA: prohibitin family protein [Steroidobacteraceae bacterium]|nr:prohibitin family protein [Steroidobacteraceae bacterium]